MIFFSSLIAAEKDQEEDSQSVTITDKDMRLKVASLKKLDNKVTEIEDMLNNEIIKY